MVSATVAVEMSFCSGEHTLIYLLSYYADGQSENTLPRFQIYSQSWWWRFQTSARPLRARKLFRRTRFRQADGRAYFWMLYWSTNSGDAIDADITDNGQPACLCITAQNNTRTGRYEDEKFNIVVPFPCEHLKNRAYVAFFPLNRGEHAASVGEAGNAWLISR